MAFIGLPCPTKSTGMGSVLSNRSVKDLNLFRFIVKSAKGKLVIGLKKSILLIEKPAHSTFLMGDLNFLLQQLNFDIKFNFITNQYTTSFEGCIPVQTEIFTIEFTG